MPDLGRVLAEKGQKACPEVIREIIKAAGYSWKKARKVLTSTDPQYQEKLAKIQSILSTLGPNERFFSIDEFGPFSVKMQGGRSLTPPGMVRVVLQRQKSKGSLIITAALELSTNQVTHFYSEKKNTAEMIKLLEILVQQYAGVDKIYLSWDAASWHASKLFFKRVDLINSPEYKDEHKSPYVELTPLPSCAQFLNVIESVFSGMARAIIHNSDYDSLAACKAAVDRHFTERNVFPGKPEEGRPDHLGQGDHAQYILLREQLQESPLLLLWNVKRRCAARMSMEGESAREMTSCFWRHSSSMC